MGSACNVGFFTLSLILTSLIVSCFAAEIDDLVNVDLSTLNATNRLLKLRHHVQGSVKITLENVTDNFDYLIVQVHSFEYTVTIRDDNDESINGTNVGLIKKLTGVDASFNYTVEGNDFSIINVLIAIIGYYKEEPVPGGCNLTFETEDAPYQKISYVDPLIRVDAQPPKYPHLPCSNTTGSVSIYHAYLDEQDFSADVYFEAIGKMLLPKDIRRHGTKITRPRSLPNIRSYFAAYQGVGSIYGIVAGDGETMSAYIPAVVYACDITHIESCNGPLSTIWRVVCSLMVFYGLFLCFWGHTFFQFNLFCMGFLFASCLVYVCGSYVTLTEGETWGTLAVVGVFYGVLWLIVWWRYGRPILSVTLSYFAAGFVITGLLYHFGLGDVDLFRNGVNYWCVLTAIALIIVLVFLILTHYHANIVATSLVGAYIFVIPIDYYLGGTIRYSYINIIRRATARKFNLAVLDPPLQANEINLILTWILVSLLGIYIQRRRNRGRAPFPPLPQIVRSYADESTPLIRAGTG